MGQAPFAELGQADSAGIGHHSPLVAGNDQGGARGDASGIFVYEQDGIVSGLEVYGLAGDAPRGAARA